MLYSSGWDRTIRGWDVAARKQFALSAGVRATAVVAASPDGRTLAYADDSGTIRLVDAERGTERRTLALPGTEYSQLVFSPDGRRLAGGGRAAIRSTSRSGICRVGNYFMAGTGRKDAIRIRAVESLCFTPDGRRLAAADFRQSAAYIWDLKLGQQVARLSHNQIYGLSFSPDGETLVTAGWDSIFRFWETDTGEPRRQVKVADDGKGGDLRMCTVLLCAAGRADRHGTPRRHGSDLASRRDAVANAVSGE